MIKKLQNEFFKLTDADAALITSSSNRKYFTRFSSSAGYLLVTAKKAFFLLDFRYTEAGKRYAQNCEVIGYSNANETLLKLIKEENISKIALEYEGISLKAAHSFKELFKETGVETVFDDKLEKTAQKLRMIKTKEEIDTIKAAQDITDKAFLEILNFIKVGVTEKEVAANLDYQMRLLGADGSSFSTIVVSGENGSLCHGVPSERVLTKGDFITMDFGALLNDYHADMTRTVALSYTSDEQFKAYQTVLKAQKAALDVIKPGIDCFDVDKTARDIIEKDYKGMFGHGLGHSVGVEIHEEPRFSPTCHEILQEGMVITVEPGVYLEGKFGLRIEDMIAVTENGYENLTKSPKNLIYI